MCLQRGLFFGFLLTLSGLAQAQEIHVSSLRSTAETENSCAYSMAKKVYADIFPETPTAKFSLSTKYRYRYGIDGWKYWFTITEMQGNVQKDYSLNMRIQFSNAHKHFECRLDRDTGYPLYVTDSQDKPIIWIEGKTLAGRAADGIVNFVGQMVWPTVRSRTPAYGLLR